MVTRKQSPFGQHDAQNRSEEQVAEDEAAAAQRPDPLDQSHMPDARDPGPEFASEVPGPGGPGVKAEPHGVGEGHVLRDNVHRGGSLYGAGTPLSEMPEGDAQAVLDQGLTTKADSDDDEPQPEPQDESDD